MTLPREMAHFLMLSPDEQRAAVQRLIDLGWSDTTIAAATRLSVEAIRSLRGSVQQPVAEDAMPKQRVGCDLQPGCTGPAFLTGDPR